MTEEMFLCDKSEREEILKERLKAIFDNSKAAYLYFEGRALKEFNLSAGKIFSKAGLQLVIGEENSEAIKKVIGKDYQIIFENAERGKKGFAENIIIGTDNVEHFLEIEYIPILNKRAEACGINISISDVTEEKLCDRTLSESEEKFREINSNIDQGIWLSNKTGIIYINHMFEAIIGREMSGILKNPDCFFEFIIDEDIESVKNEFEGEFLRGVKKEIEFRIKNETFEVKWCRLRTTSFEFNGEERMLGLIEDITDKKKTEERFIYLHKKFNNHVDNMPLGYLEMDRNFMVKRWNLTAEKIFGYTEGEAVGEMIYNLIVPENNVRISRGLGHKLINNNTESSVSENITKLGKRIYCEWHNTSLKDKNGKILGWGSIFQDITERKAAEAKLIAAKEEVDRAHSAKSEFLANMSHEIRTPMNAVMGFSELLRQRINDETSMEYLSGIITSGRNLVNLINDILDMSKIEAGKMVITNTHTDVFSLAAEVRQIFMFEAEKNNVKIVLDVKDIPKSMLIDEIRLRQILINIVGNAVKFTHKGYVRISVEALKNMDNSYNMIINIRDTGIGIAKDQMETIFAAFHQQEGQSTRKYGGTGLGLTITKKLIELMGGSISVESELGKGSEFTVKLEKIAVGENIEKNMAEEIDLSCISGKTVLCCDDLVSNRKIIKGFLEPYGVKIIEADTGKQCIELAEKHGPDLIFMDFVMQDMDGTDIAEIIRRKEKTAGVPIIFVSIYRADKFGKSELYEGFIQKPITFRSLVTEINRVYDGRCQINKKAEKKLELHEIELLEETEALFQEKYDNICEGIVIIDEIIEFTENIKRLTASKSIDYVNEFAEKLQKAAKAYDIVKIEEIMENYKRYLESYL